VNLPVAYLLGIAALLIAEMYEMVLPGSGSVSSALLVLPLFCLSPLLSFAAILRVRRRGAADSGAWMLDRRTTLLLRLSVAAVPLAYVTLLVPGTWLDLADRWSDGGSFVGLLLLLAPLVVLETMRHWVETIVAAGGRDAAVLRDLRARMAIIALFTVPWLLLSVLGDMLRPYRSIYLFGLTTTVGLSVSILLFVLLLGMLIPLLFRWLFGLSDRIPEPLGSDLRETAGTLGFPGRAVLWLDSSLRIVNALLLGPLPWPRYLVVSDGLAAILDKQAMRGVVAHEVGHAQAGHPLLLLALFVFTPLFFMTGLQAFDLSDLEEVWSLAIAAVVLLLGLWLLRRVAHRFEHEADVLSAVALGGAEPCISALHRVGQVIQHSPERGSLLHPSESDRIRLLREFASDARFRARFTMRGLRLRRWIGGLFLSSLLLAGWSWLQAWPLEKAAFRFLNGDLAGAQQQVEEVGVDVPAGMWQWWHRLQEDLAAARMIAGDGGSWEAVSGQLIEEGWRRGVETLMTEGPLAARRWFALAIDEDRPSPLARSIVRFCEAAEVEDLDEMQRLSDHIRTLGVPPELVAFFGS
jgi:Zn-dependent protease with chaperone function